MLGWLLTFALVLAAVATGSVVLAAMVVAAWAVDRVVVR